jgi:hypothetical protein
MERQKIRFWASEHALIVAGLGLLIFLIKRKNKENENVGFAF